MGNICRSPTADAVFRHLVKAAGVDHLIHVDSAGTHAYHIGNPPDHRAQNTALQRGYKMHDLRARAVQPNDFEEFDYILAMDKENLSLLQQRSPQQHLSKIQLFMQYSTQADLMSRCPIRTSAGTKVLNWYWIWLRKPARVCWRIFALIKRKYSDENKSRCCLESRSVVNN